ncbi:MAG: hypothetical protein JJU28_20425 [Cyclobacteriaceae bacterium]|nr:hypothetical protein [Cyclobacteriaceae bacterium]
MPIKNTRNKIAFLITLMTPFLWSCEDNDDLRTDTLFVSAGPDISALVLDNVVLDGSDTEDLDGNPISYTWEFTSKPPSSQAEIEMADQPVARFVPDTWGDYVVQLTASTEFEVKTASTTVTAEPQSIFLSGVINSVDAEWGKTTPDDMPDYIVTGSVSLRNSNIKILPGVIIEIRENNWILVESNSSLEAEGTADEMIVFRGAEPLPGYWDGIRIASGSGNNKLIYTHISDGGRGTGNDAGLVSFRSGGRLHLENSIIENSSAMGLNLGISTNPDLNLTHKNNVYINNQAPVATHANYFHLLDAESDYSQNQRAYIDTQGRSSIINNGSEITWEKLNVPYSMGTAFVRTQTHLNLEPGVHLQFAANERMVVDSDGRISFKGTSDDKIVIEGIDEIKGFWQGILLNASMNNNAMDHVIIRGAGSASLSGGVPRAAIGVRNSRLNIDHADFIDINGYAFGTFGTNELEKGENINLSNVENGMIN